jgi:hypothetical protein
MDTPLEADIEDKFVKYAASKGCRAIKFAIPGRRYAPDRMVLCPGGITFFIEFKRPGEKPTQGQLAYHEKLRKLGYEVYVTDSQTKATEKLIKHLYNNDPTTS